MSRIITVGRQFGSGGRELGKRLSDELGVPYYDREIISEIAKRTELAEEYVHRIVEQRPEYHFPITVGRTLQGGASDYLMQQYASVYAEQTNVIRELAERSDCVIVGRCADYILRDRKPLRIFVYADMDFRMARCRERGQKDEVASERKLRRKILAVDRNRRRYYRSYTGQAWGNPANYDICLNTAGTDIKAMAHALAVMIKADQE
ncbi:MAG: cytidylate kinase-like family protein [Ruminococcaceae bacterium]|nr:cytidylate kinase-like family protein [Oscillospiraceae bacterium]